MGLFDSLSKFIGGGSDSSSSGGSSSGFALLPPELQTAFKNYANQLTSQFSNPADATAAFTPLPQTSFETSGLNSIQQGVAPTAQSLQSDIAMQMNPYDDFVINDVNRQADGQYSILKQAANEAGQMGSNRQLLGANDIEQTRLNTIGGLRQSEYNTALSNALGPLANLRQQDISNDFTAGDFLRGLDTQTKQAPYAGLQTFGQLLGALPQSGGSTSSQESSSSSQNGMGKALSGLGSAGTISSLFSLFSDERLKENIVHVGYKNGHEIYEFNYIGSPERYRGVLAQNVRDIEPDAVAVDPESGFLKVNYAGLGLEMEAA